MDCSMPGFSVLRYLPEFAQTRVHWVSDAIQPSHLLSPISSLVAPFLSCPHSFPASGSFPVSQLFASGDQSIGASASGLISFRIDWFDLHATQETLESLLQHHSWKASVFWHSPFFIVQLGLKGSIQCSCLCFDLQNVWSCHSSDWWSWWEMGKKIYVGVCGIYMRNRDLSPCWWVC